MDGRAIPLGDHLTAARQSLPPGGHWVRRLLGISLHPPAVRRTRDYPPLRNGGAARTAGHGQAAGRDEMTSGGLLL